MKVIKKQNKIIEERLNYHFSNVNGGFNIPKDMPFMKEFLSEIEKLCKLINKK